MKKTYERIAKRRALITSYSLWVNSVFLLSISTGLFSEKYKRFYFQDIKSLVLCQTETWKIWNWTLGLLVAMLALIIMAADGMGAIYFGLSGVLIFVALVINNIRGPSCVCYVETAVQKEKLNSLRRIKNAQKAMDTLKPHIMQIQRKKASTGI